MSAQHGKAQCAGQRARVGKLFLLVLLTLSRPPERCARQYPGPIVQVMVRNVRQQADILEFQLQRIFLVSPEPHSRQLQRIVAKVALTDFQFKEQAGQGRRARVLTYRLHYYVNVGKLHVVVHLCGLKRAGPTGWSAERRSEHMVTRAGFGETRQIANFTPFACAFRPTTGAWMPSHRLEDLVAQGQGPCKDVATCRTHPRSRACIGWRRLGSGSWFRATGRPTQGRSRQRPSTGPHTPARTPTTDGSPYATIRYAGGVCRMWPHR